MKSKLKEEGKTILIRWMPISRDTMNLKLKKGRTAESLKKD